MSDDRLPKNLLLDELQHGKRSKDEQKKKCSKDTLEALLKSSISATTHGSSKRKTEESGDQLSTKVPNQVRQTGPQLLNRECKPGKAELLTLHATTAIIPCPHCRNSSTHRLARPAICVCTETRLYNPMMD